MDLEFIGRVVLILMGLFIVWFVGLVVWFAFIGWLDRRRMKDIQDQVERELAETIEERLRKEM